VYAWLALHSCIDRKLAHSSEDNLGVFLVYDLRGANLSYLDHRIDLAPKYNAQIAPQITRVFPGLERFHAYGLLLTGSQPREEWTKLKIAGTGSDITAGCITPFSPCSVPYRGAKTHECCTYLLPPIDSPSAANAKIAALL
jgi:hypothetical protein